MKYIVMLVVILSAFFMFSCGGSDSGTSGGITENEFYTTTETRICERGFECDIEYLKAGKKDISECKVETTQSNCPYDFNGVNAKECNDCVKALTCTEYDEGKGIVDKCPICSKVCVYKQ